MLSCAGTFMFVRTSRRNRKISLNYWAITSLTLIDWRAGMAGNTFDRQLRLLFRMKDELPGTAVQTTLTAGVCATLRGMHSSMV